MVHELKTWPKFFDEVLAGRKTFELRKADRPYEVGDLLHLCEWDPSTAEFTKRSVFAEVRYMARGPAFGLQEGYVCMAIRLTLTFVS